MKPSRNNICAPAVPVVTCFQNSFGHKVVQSYNVLECCKKNYPLAEDKFPTLDTHTFELEVYFKCHYYFKQPIIVYVLAIKTKKLQQAVSSQYSKLFIHVNTLPFDAIKKKIR